MQGPIIQVKGLRKSYGKTNVLNGLSFQVEPGTIFALLGENGAGKTTTVRILSTLITADEGAATIAGNDCRRDADSIRKRISMTGQYAAVDELLTGEENLYMMGRLYRLDSEMAKKRSAELLDEFDLTDAAKKPAKSYSGGMRRKLDIAISLIASPSIIFLDEPTTGLDPRSRLNMWHHIKALAKSGVTIFLTTQYLDEADMLADKIAVLDGGKIIVEGTAEELKRSVGQEKIELGFFELEVSRKAQELLQGHLDESNCTLSIASDDCSTFLRPILNTLHAQGIEPTFIRIRKPTLDDVFLEFTGKPSKEVVCQ
ncbi:MAG: ATP-binding cassette domain-containing protein [Bacillota bacterium]